VTEYRLAIKALAVLAAEMRPDWDYRETGQAVFACSQAGWSPEQIYREAFRLLLIADSGPADLRHKAAKPTLGSTGAEVNQRGKELALEAYRQTKGAQHCDDDPEGDEAA